MLPGVRLGFLAVVLAVALSSCGSGPGAGKAKTLGGTLEHLKVGGQTVVLAHPKRPTSKVVLYIHGADETADGAFTDVENAPVFTVLLRGGYAIAADQAHGNAWGNAASQRDYETLRSVLRRRGLRDVYVLAQSMGGFNGLRLAQGAKAWAGIYPACNLQAMHRQPGFREPIEQAYGPALAAALREGPVRAGRRGLAMHFWASPDDSVVPKRSNTDRCAAAARARGARVTVTTTRGDHGDLSNFDAPAILRLFNGA